MANETIGNSVARNSENKGTSKKQYTTDEINTVLNTKQAQDMIQKMIAEALAKQPQQIIVNRQQDEMITLLYMGAVAEGSMVELWDGFEIQGRGGTRDVPKKEFLQHLSQKVLKRLKDRRLIVVDGFTENEKERYGVNYTDSELAGVEIYYKLLTYDEDKIISIFKSVCDSHKAIIASLFKTAYINHDNRINQPLIEKLNKISKKTDENGMFSDILKDMAKSLSEQGSLDEE